MIPDLVHRKTLRDSIMQGRIRPVLQVPADRAIDAGNSRRQGFEKHILFRFDLIVQRRGLYNLVDSRAKRIARTEITAAMNGGSLLYLKSIGATGKKWITANDEVVRHSHSECQAQGEIGIDMSFDANGMQAPGMGDDPAEVINCRCSIIGTFN